MASSKSPGDRVTALGSQMLEVHASLRDTLTELRADLAASPNESGQQPRSLISHCLAFCAALDRHHNGEDRTVFPTLAQQFPDLRPVLQQLEHDHEFMAGILRQINQQIGTLGSDGALDAARIRQVRDQIEGLSAVLESHLRYEERKIVDALNQLPGSDLDTTDFLVTDKSTS